MTMSALQSLKLVAARKSAQSPTAIKRQKLASKLQEQMDLIAAQQEGRSYVAKRMQWTNDADTGARVAVEVNKRVREWFWAADGGKLNAVIKYGASTLALGKGGKNAIEVGNMAELADAFSAVKSAVLAGELDEAIADASVRTRKAFGK
jgi:hypothetical protein